MKPPTIGGVEPAVRRHAGGDGDRHRQRQRDDRDRQAGDDIGAEIREAVAFAQDRDELWRDRVRQRSADAADAACLRVRL